MGTSSGLLSVVFIGFRSIDRGGQRDIFGATYFHSFHPRIWWVWCVGGPLEGCFKQRRVSHKHINKDGMVRFVSIGCVGGSPLETWFLAL